MSSPSPVNRVVDVAHPEGAARRFGQRTVLGLAALLVGGIPFLILWLLVSRNWAPLAEIDGGAATALAAFANVTKALPAVRKRVRPWLDTVWVVTFLTVGFSRLALGVHFVSDVLAGWAMGAALLAVTAATFRGWQHDRASLLTKP